MGRGAVVACLALAAALAAACGGAGAPTAPPAATPPAEFREVAVAFDSPGAPGGLPATLCGTLTLPARSTPAPGVVLVHGSGPNDRDGTLPAVLALDRTMDARDGRVDTVMAFPRPATVLRDVAHALAARGIAVLRYDKRSFLALRGSSCGPAPALDPRADTIGDLVADSAAAAAALRGRPEVDARRIFIAGHSEGAHVALAHVAPGAVAGVASLAGAGRPVDVEVTGQLERALAYVRAWPPGAERDQAVASVEPQLAAARVAFARLRGGTFGAADTFLGYGRAYWLSWIELSDRVGDIVAESAIPVFLVNGTLDFNVPPESFELLRQRARPGETAVLLPDVTHALTDAGTAARPEVSPLVTGALADWIARHSN